MPLPGRLLVLSPHTDDGELAAGGTIAKQIDAGGEIFYIAFSSAEKSLPPGVPRGTLRTECMTATRALGVPLSHVKILEHEVRNFPARRQQILELLTKARDNIRPDLVLLPSSQDVHQDHQVIHIEAIRAFKTSASMWGYEHPRNNLSFDFDVLVSLNRKQAKRKIDALRHYKSQLSRTYFDPSYLYGLMRTHGVQAGFEYAEAFELIRDLIR